ncbi:Ff.00g064800.m01.CDS01 [Fusarium sp. VM40]|nr:Ff.00g064800.m01.CDS01 [Fusarium sp. VM40]
MVAPICICPVEARLITWYRGETANRRERQAQHHVMRPRIGLSCMPCPPIRRDTEVRFCSDGEEDGDEEENAGEVEADRNDSDGSHGIGDGTNIDETPDTRDVVVIDDESDIDIQDNTDIPNHTPRSYENEDTHEPVTNTRDEFDIQDCIIVANPSNLGGLKTYIALAV